MTTIPGTGKAVTGNSSFDNLQNNDISVAFDDAEERYLREALAILHQSYTKAAKPYMDRLVAIHAIRPPAPMLVSVEQAQALGLLTHNAQVQANGATKINEGDGACSVSPATEG